MLESLRSIDPSASLTEVLSKLREWRRSTVRAEELTFVLPDPSLMVKTLEKAIMITLMTDPQVNLKLNLQRNELEMELTPSYASADAFAKYI